MIVNPKRWARQVFSQKKSKNKKPEQKRSSFVDFLVGGWYNVCIKEVIVPNRMDWGDHLLFYLYSIYKS